MNAKRFLKWSLVLLALIAYKQMESDGGSAPREAQYEYMSYEAE